MIIRRLRLLLIRLGFNPLDGGDGFGSYSRRWCEKCGGDVAWMRPGSAVCQNCLNKKTATLNR